jgi:hypothetical protein
MINQIFTMSTNRDIQLWWHRISQFFLLDERENPEARTTSVKGFLQKITSPAEVKQMQTPGERLPS